MPDVNVTIDGHKLAVPAGMLVVEAAKLVGIEIPVFCYHHKLDPVGACRLCLVELSPGPPRPQTGCTTPVAEGMVVKTLSPMAVQARADILEFELVNHPLDCPVCDKGGECPLQDFTFRHGYPTSRIDGPRLHFKKPIPLSENIALDRERCVLCYRCTRYYDEVAWEQELTTGQRGVQSYITSQFDYTDVNDPERLRTPRIAGARATWADALTAVANGIKGKGAKLGVSLPKDITNEEAFLFRRLLDGPLKGAKVKMHGRTALPAPTPTIETLRIKEIEDARVIVVVASDIEDDAPIVNLRIKKAVSKRGAKLIVVHPDGVDLDRDPSTVHIRNKPGSAAAEVRKLASHALLKAPGGPVAILFGDGHGSEEIVDLAKSCRELA